MKKNYISILCCMLMLININAALAKNVTNNNQKTPGFSSASTPSSFFLTPDEIAAARGGLSRNNIFPYTLTGNDVQLLVNGDNFFSSLYKDINDTKDGDFIWMTGWDINSKVMLLPPDKNTEIEKVLIDAIKRHVDVRVLINQNLYSPLTAINFCSPLNTAAGYTVCSPDNRHNSSVGSIHQKAWVIKRNDDTVAYVGSMDISSGRYDNAQHNQDSKWQSQPKFTQGYYGWTGGMLEIKGQAVNDIARHLYQQINDPACAYTVLGQCVDSIAPEKWSNPPIKKYQSNTEVQALFTASPLAAEKYSYYSNWAPKGETTILADTIKAIQHAKKYIFISDQFMWYPPILNAINKQLPKIKSVVLVTDSGDALDHYIAGYDLKSFSNSKYYYQYKAWQPLLNNPKVSSYQIIKEGLDQNSIKNIIYTHWKVLIVDDEYAIIGTAGVEQAGMTNDIDMSIGIYNPVVVKKFREQLWREYLNLPSTYQFNADPIIDITNLWPSIAKKKGRIRTYWPKTVTHYAIYDTIFDLFEPCGFIDQSKCQAVGAIY